MNDKTNKVMELLRSSNADDEYISPNYVAEFAYNRGIKLTSDEVVYISDHYNYIDPCGHKAEIDKQNKNMPEEMRDIMN